MSASCPAAPASPPWKLLAGQLRQAGCRSREQAPEQAPAPAPAPAPARWLLRREASGRPPLELGLVWMQGTVQEVRPENDISLRLLDPSGSFTVTGASRVPKGRPCIAAGKYVMVMGVVQSCSPEPIIRAVKLTDLSSNALHRSMWQLEVEDLQQNIP